MSVTLKIFTSLVALTAATSIFADTCKDTNDDLPFRQVVLGKGNAVRCDYGKDFDFKHSYTLYGNYQAVSGPWSGTSEPMTLVCSGFSESCVFKIENKSVKGH